MLNSPRANLAFHCFTDPRSYLAVSGLLNYQRGEAAVAHDIAVERTSKGIAVTTDFDHSPIRILAQSKASTGIRA